MRCPSCGFDNPQGLKFCEECGTQLLRVCPSCGQQVRPTAKFCGDCGTTLEAEGKPTSARSRGRKGAQAPRRAPRSSRSPVTTPSRPARRTRFKCCENRGVASGREETNRPACV